MFVAFDDEVWVWGSCFWGERFAVDEVAEVGGEGAGVAVAVCGLCWGGSWFGVLTGEASDSGDREGEAMDHDEGHLEEDFEFVGDVFWAALF